MSPLILLDSFAGMMCSARFQNTLSPSEKPSECSSCALSLPCTLGLDYARRTGFELCAGALIFVDHHRLQVAVLRR